MARTLSQVFDELVRIFPPEWSDNVRGVAILTGIATVLRGREVKVDAASGWNDQVYIATSEGIYLDEHGAQTGVSRLPGEADSVYAPRIRFKPRILTGGNPIVGDGGGDVLGELSLYLPNGYTVVAEEPYLNVLDDGFFLADTAAILTNPRVENPEPKFLGWITIPIPEVVYVLESFLAIDAFLGVDAFLDETIDDLNRRHIRQILAAIEAQRGYGVAIGVSVADVPQLVYFDALFETGSGGYV